MLRVTPALLLTALAATVALSDGLMAPIPPSPPAAKPRVTPKPPPVAVVPAPPAPARVEPTYDGPAYDALRLPHWTDDFIEPWVPSDVPRDHWSYEWLSWLAEEGLLRDLFPTEAGGKPAPPRKYTDEGELAARPDLLDSIIRLTDQGVVVGGKDGAYQADRAATRREVGLAAGRAAEHLRAQHPRMALVHPPGEAAPLVDLDACATRYELAEALVRTMRVLGPLDLTVKTELDRPRAEWVLPPDVPANHRFAPAVYAAIRLGVLTTRADGAFGGSDIVLRDELAMGFYRLLDALAFKPAPPLAE